MTILESTSVLFNHFKTRDSFCLDEDFLSLRLISDVDSTDSMKASLSLALKTFKDSGFLETTKIGEKEFWVLKQHLTSMPQTLSLSGDCAISIAEAINHYAKATNNTNLKSDPLNISELDIITLMTVVDLISEEFIESNKTAKKDGQKM